MQRENGINAQTSLCEKTWGGDYFSENWIRGKRGARCQQSANDHGRFSSGSNFHFPQLGDVEQNNPVSSETKRNNERKKKKKKQREREKRERKGEKEGKKQREASFRPSKITLIREEKRSGCRMQGTGWISKRERRGDGWNIGRKFIRPRNN